MISVRKSLFSLVFAAVLLGSGMPRVQEKASTNVSEESLTRTINSTRQLRDTDGTAHRRITSVVNCTRRGSVAGVSGIDGGMNTSTAGTRNATGTSTTTTEGMGACGCGA